MVLKCENCLEEKELIQYGHCAECIKELDEMSCCCSSSYDSDRKICGCCKEHTVSAWDSILIDKIGFDVWFKIKGKL